MTEAALQRDYLQDVMKRTGWSQTELAARAGLDPSTLSRFLSGASEGRALRASSIGKIESVTGVPIDSGTQGSAPPANPASGLAEPEAVPLLTGTQPHLQAVIDVLSRNGRNVDPWTLCTDALEAAGYRRGDIILVALGETPLEGDVVCAQVYDWVNGKAETIFRIFQPPYLVAASTDPRQMRPLVVDDTKVHIKGVAVTTIRGRHHL